VNGSVPAAEARRVTVMGPPTLAPAALWRRMALLPRHGHLIAALTMHRIKVRYKQSALGPAWAILQPLAMMTVFATVFSFIGSMPASGHPYAVFAYAGLLPWTAFSSATASASTSLVTHASLVTRVYFPREILPLTYVFVALFDLAVASTVLAGMLAWYDVTVTAHVLWVFPLLLLLAALTFAVALVLCTVNVRFRDVGVAMPLILQVGMFASPVIYPLDAVPPAWRDWYVLNPMVGVVDGFRRAVLDGLPPDPGAVGASVLVVAVLLPAAYVWFKQVEATMADHV
jgi:lipopolysaccharide transport system permease protein